MCIAKGAPDSNYRYGKWIQRWPGYGVPVSVRPGSETLELTGLTYEHSGFYTCTASNGIKVFGTNIEFIEGKEVHLLVKSFPVIITMDDKFASRINKNVTVKVDYFSNVPGTEVKLYKNVNGAGKTGVTLFVDKNPVEIELPVFSHFVKINGTRSIVTIPIKSEVDYGSYIVVVSNEIGSSNRSFEVVLTEQPGSPRGFTIDYIQHNKARLSWMRGYNGGLTQTFVIQVGTDEKTWSDVKVFDRITKDEKPITTVLSDLHDSTTYFVRAYAYNEEGNSPLSKTLNFTTSSIKVKVTIEANNTSTIIMGVVLGIVIVAFVISMYVIVQLKRKLEHNPNKDISKDTSSRKYVNVDDSIKLKTENVKKKGTSPDVQASESQYTELDKDLKEAESAYDAISTM
ncbi:neural cell adhesion molecule 2-like [Ruditapes philippinarum]|uniref:neural cell adhesion molecule 2-like n=1 Tax=Ruditapes philippinarum TaxID=129788 RepID=UPI00295A6BFA|nr:neural cell adhesion molecule 2-like [Ruditapes philippinarum]